MEIILFVSLIIFILGSSGLVSGSEAALLSVSYAKAKEILRHSKSPVQKVKAANLIFVKENLKKYITTIVVLNNLINIIGSIYVGILATVIFEESFYVGIVSGVLTFLIIIFSEIIPKLYGEKYSDKISLTIAGPLIFLGKLFSPIIFLLNKVTSVFVRESVGKTYISEGEIREMASLGNKEGTINDYENKVISKVFKMDDLDVYDIMIPKNKVVFIDVKFSFDDIVKLVENTGFTRFPVIKDDEVVGLINAKDLFKFYGGDKFSIYKILRPIVFAPESMKIFSLEDRLKKQRNHMAIVVNEHGDFVGIVTLEDIIEELLGEIEDEFDKMENPVVRSISTNVFHVDASASMERINQKFGLGFELEGEEYSTLNGFLIHEFGRIPKVNDVIKFGGGVFRVIKASKRKVIETELVLKEN